MLRTFGLPASVASHASLRDTEYGKYLAMRIAVTPAGTVSVKRCCVVPTSVGSDASGMRVYEPNVVPFVDCAHTGRMMSV